MAPLCCSRSRVKSGRASSIPLLALKAVYQSLRGGSGSQQSPVGYTRRRLRQDGESFVGEMPSLAVARGGRSNSKMGGN